jgi:hypothetical protein
MASEQMALLPTELNARFLYLCQRPTIHGSQQAKCSFLHDGKEYMGILFLPDGEEWFEEVAKDTLIKACRISPCDNEKYPGEYKGTALPLSQQSLKMMYTPVKTESVVIDMSLTPVYLREAAAYIEALLAAANKTPAEQPQKQVQKKLPYRSPNQWTDKIIEIIRSNENFRTKQFSAIGLNAYMENCFDDFWEGDLVMLENGLRWRRGVCVALSKLLTRNFIERVPGTQKHYQITEQTIN